MTDLLAAHKHELGLPYERDDYLADIANFGTGGGAVSTEDFADEALVINGGLSYSVEFTLIKAAAGLSNETAYLPEVIALEQDILCAVGEANRADQAAKAVEAKFSSAYTLVNSYLQTYLQERGVGSDATLQLEADMLAVQIADANRGKSMAEIYVIAHAVLELNKKEAVLEEVMAAYDSVLARLSDTHALAA